jgi:uncharacterized protein
MKQQEQMVNTGEQMVSEEELMIRKFYSHFQQKDWRGMLGCFQDNIAFYDPVFENLEGPEVRSMWEMLMTSAKDLTLEFRDIESEEGYGSCHWVATYTFSRTGRRVVNKGRAFFKFSEGLIAEHQDDFDLWKWSRQALGISGLLLGWTPFMHRKIRQKAGKSLEKFMTRSTS